MDPTVHPSLLLLWEWNERVKKTHPHVLLHTSTTIGSRERERGEASGNAPPCSGSAFLLEPCASLCSSFVSIQWCNQGTEKSTFTESILVIYYQYQYQYHEQWSSSIILSHILSYICNAAAGCACMQRNASVSYAMMQRVARVLGRRQQNNSTSLFLWAELLQ